jgi:glycerophosphoryl diester phosphodiesterase
MPHWLDQAFLRTVDALYALPRRRATPAQLAACRIVAHRGERDDRTVFENTYAAFDPLRGTGIFGIEFDVRWTADLVPVVFHDASFARLFEAGGTLRETDLAALRLRFPQVPTLHDFVRRYCDEFHLMAELKHEPYPDPALQDRRLAEALAPALARGRCHVLSLVPEMFGWLRDIPARATMGVARLNTRAIGDEALVAGRGGFSCHYATLTRAQIARHHAAGQVVGCGFPDSEAVMRREIGRGVDYVFSNRALAMRALVMRAGSPAPRG